MKRMISVIISAALLLSMAGCGKVPAVEPVPSTEPESVPVSQAEVYCMELDYGRLYLQGKDELEYPILTVDSTCLAYGIHSFCPAHSGRPLCAGLFWIQRKPRAMPVVIKRAMPMHRKWQSNYIPVTIKWL